MCWWCLPFILSFIYDLITNVFIFIAREGFKCVLYEHIALIANFLTQNVHPIFSFFFVLTKIAVQNILDGHKDCSARYY